MAWWMAAAAAAPYVMQALQGRPDSPSYRDPGLPTDRSKYINQMLDAGFNPNNELLLRASAQAEDRVNRILGRTGMGGSSIGGQVHALTQAELASKFLENQLDRQARALAPVLAYDNNIYNARAGNAQAQYQSAMDAYGMAAARNAGQINNLSGLVNAGLGYYQMNQADTYRQQQLAQNQQIIDMMRSNYGSPQYGVPGYQPAAPNPYSLGDYTFRPGI